MVRAVGNLRVVARNTFCSEYLQNTQGNINDKITGLHRGGEVTTVI